MSHDWNLATYFCKCCGVSRYQATEDPRLAECRSNVIGICQRISERREEERRNRINRIMMHTEPA